MDYEQFYKQTYNYLVKKAENHNINEKALQKYFTPQTGNGVLFQCYRNDPMKDLFYRFAFHAQDGSLMSRVIKFPTTNSVSDCEKRKQFQKVLCDFDYDAVLKKYGTTDKLFEEFILEFNLPRISAQSKTNNYKKSMPYKYCDSLMSAAIFLKQFTDYDAFIEKLHSLGEMAPVYVSFEVYGFDIALSCDFIKELGCSMLDLPKPDVHIVKVLFALGLIDEASGPKASYQTIKQMKIMVDEIQRSDPTVTSYKLDKILWLICSETFYDDDNVRNSGDQKRKAYIDAIKQWC